MMFKMLDVSVVQTWGLGIKSGLEPSEDVNHFWGKRLVMLVDGLAMLFRNILKALLLLNEYEELC